MKKINFILCLFCASVALTLLGCDDFTKEPETTAPKTPNGKVTGGEKPVTDKKFEGPKELKPFSSQQMLLDISKYVIQPATIDLYAKATELKKSVDTYCSSITGATSDLKKDFAQLAWKQAMLSLHTMDTMVIGPMHDQARGLYLDMYSWTATSTCGIDREVVSAWGNPSYKISSRDNRKGLDAIEYLLFENTLSHSCSAGVDALKSWNALSSVQKSQRRCHMSAILATEFENDALILAQAWSEKGGNYTQTLINNSHFKNHTEAINHISDALFFIDLDLKDTKLGLPLGQNEDYLSPELVEHRWSKMFKDAHIATLIGAKSLFLGEPLFLNGYIKTDLSNGFDDYLKKVRQPHDPDVSQKVLTSIDTTIEILKKLPQTFSFEAELRRVDRLPNGKSDCETSTSTDRKIEVCAIYKDIKSITDLIKLDFLVALKLHAPKQAEGDDD